MFRGKIYLYKNTEGREEELKKEFDNEAEFNSFIDSNPELKKLQEWSWEITEWPQLSGFKDRYAEAQKSGDKSYVDQMKEELEAMEKRMGELFEKSKNFLGK